MENVLGLIRARRLTPDSEIITFLLSASDVLRDLIQNFEQCEPKDISEIIGGLSSIVSQNQLQAQAQKIGESDKQGIRLLLADSYLDSNLTGEQIANARKQGGNIYLVRFKAGASEQIDDGTLENLSERFKPYGNILANNINDLSDGANEDSGYYRGMVFSCVLLPDDVVLLCDSATEEVFQIDEDCRCIRIKQNADSAEAPKLAGDEALKEDLSEQHSSIFPQKTDHLTVSQRELGADDQDYLSVDRKTSLPHAVPQSSVRVSVQLLESLMNLAGELVLSRNQLLQAITAKNERTIDLVGQRLDMVTSELQEAIMLTRMQPLGRLFNKFPRMGRDVARHLGKEVQMLITGKEVELDRKLLEAISDPITHLVRNAIDHGIESAATRKQLGKGEIGNIKLDAFHEAGQVVIEVSDDGRGLDTEKLASAAVAKGFVSEEQIKMMGLREKMNLVFLPGLSSAERVSEISGRGVGMDVVKNNIDKLGGLIDLNSQPGKGTQVRIKLPLTLAIIPCQIVRIETERYAVPQVNIEELLRIPAAQIKKRIEVVGQAPVLRLRENLLPLVRLCDILGIDRTYVDQKSRERKPDQRENIADRRSRKWDSSGREILKEAEDSESTAEQDARSGTDRRYHASSSLSIVVVGNGLAKYGLIVDGFMDSAEIVVKPLGRHLKECPAYAGAAIMGDGRVALILDVGNIARLADLSQLGNAGRAAEFEEDSVTVDDVHETFLLTFRNNDDEQMAVPLDQVVRIERIKTFYLETAGGMRVMPYRGRSLPVLAVHEVAAVKPLPENKQMMAIIFQLYGQDVGLLVNGPLDAVHAAAEIDTHTLRQPGITGSLIIDGRTTLLVDIFELTRNRYPNWLNKVATNGIIRKKKATILVVEDSNFFRTHTTELLQNEGYSTVAAEDGEVAWEVLQRRREDVALVVTDLEMPKLDGFDLIKRIRRDEQLSKLPVIALTTLADDEDIERGRALGVDDYQIKLDKEKFVESVTNLLNRSR